MTDPFADVRELLRQSRPIPDSVAFPLLTDVDALFRYYKAHREVEKGAISFTLEHKQVKELEEALAALPEHLK